jgi:hypothetical protein
LVLPDTLGVVRVRADEPFERGALLVDRFGDVVGSLFRRIFASEDGVAGAGERGDRAIDAAQ